MVTAFRGVLCEVRAVIYAQWWLVGTLPRRTLPGRWLLPDAATVAAAAAAIAVEADLPRNSASNGVLNRTIRYRCGCSCRSALSSGCGAISSPAATGNEEEIRSIIGIGPRYGRFTGVGAVVMVVVVVVMKWFTMPDAHQGRMKTFAPRAF
uniref:Uncharacterized protein n=1 Tax=Anopheles merus TaxID=30066 RepID=A0A182V7Q4_ANOME